MVQEAQFEMAKEVAIDQENLRKKEEKKQIDNRSDGSCSKKNR